MKMHKNSHALFAYIWNFFEQLLRRFLSIVVTLILAIFLLPDDFGVVAMMAVFLAIGQSLMNSGFSQALIRMKNPSQDDFSTAFYCNLLLSILSYSLLFFTAPFIADFYDQPMLIDMIRVAGISIFIQAFQVVQVAQMSRELNFKVQVRASIPASVFSGVLAIFLAIRGFGAWSIILQMIVSGFVQTVILWVVQGWRPNFRFSATSALGMYSFGYKLFISSLIDILFRNIYVIVIAKSFSASAAGIFFLADRIREGVINQIVNTIQTVSYPSLSRLQDDATTLKDSCRGLVRITNFVFLPILTVLIVCSEVIFSLFLDEQWFPGAAQLQLMCVASVMYPMHAINLNILKVKARSDLFLKLEVLKRTLVAVVLFFSLGYGIKGILLGQIFTSIISYFPNSYYSERLIGYSVKEQLDDFLPAFFCAALSLVVGWLFLSIVEAINLALKLFFVFVTILLAYLALAYLFKVEGLLLIVRRLRGLPT